MKQLSIHFLIILFSLPAFAQKDSLLLSKNQQRAVKFYQAFIEKSKLPVNKTASLNQFKKGLLGACFNDCGLVLSVEGLELKGTRMNASEVELTFFTLSEKNNEGFIIQRSFASTATNFDSICFIKGKRDIYSKSTYRFLDNNSNTGYTFYRLVQKDINGKATYSNIAKVQGSQIPISIQVIPNPTTSGKIYIKAEGFNSPDVQILISDAQGNLVYKNHKQIFPMSTFKLDNRFLPAGLYHVRIFNEKESASTNFVIQ